MCVASGASGLGQTGRMSPEAIAADDTSIRLVATDLDGTLLTSDEKISARTKAAAHALIDAGLELVLVTGRPPRWLPPVLADLDLIVTCVCANGAITIEPATQEVSFLAGITGADALHAAEILRAVVPEVGFAVETAPSPDDIWGHATAFAHDLEYTPRWPTAPGTKVAPLTELLDDRMVLKLLARSELRLSQREVDSIVHAAREALGQRVEVTHSERDRLLLEVSAPGVDKGAALARVAGSRGIEAKNVAAVGDMMNDLPMLQWAGHRYAVANAHPELLRIGRPLPHHDDDAVAQLLEQVIADARA